ncbi:MAG: Gfo/Idh/MocA family oxidoreductase [Phycisphaerales bacterium]|nr:Gfo/Idh/MocA family oxidoreductase [Phycisphaerales bacterium]
MQRKPQTPSPMTRRDFVRASTAATAAFAVAAPAVIAAARPSAAKELRVGLVGCGGRGTGAAVNALRADPDVVLWAVGDLFAERHDGCLQAIEGEMRTMDEEGGGGDRNLRRVQVDAARRFDGFDNYQKVIDNCDVVLLCTPPVFRPEHYVAAIKAGKHVFCEKPVSVDAPGVRAVIEASRQASEKGLTVVSGFCWRYSDRERETYQRIHDGAIGPLRAVYTTYNTTGWVAPRVKRPEWSDIEWQIRDWHYFYPMSGDHIVEQAVHSIDKIHWAFNGRAPQRCVAVGGRAARPNVPETGNVYDHFSITWDYDDGAKAFHMCRHYPNCPSDNSDYLLGEKGTCTVNGWTDTHVITGENAWTCTAPRNDMYQQEHDEMFAAIRAGKPINNGQRMAESTLLAIMARMAAYTGQVVTWEQAMSSQESLLPPRWEWTSHEMPRLAVPGTTKVV